ncbi:MAG: cell envelope integrity protein TolA [Oleispira sp.]|nr:cell envelope integrity protein TolA [Oleispira sp.]
MTDKGSQTKSAELSEQDSLIKRLLDPQGYALAIIVALTLHIVVIALFATEWPEDKRQIAEPTPKNIQAKVIQVENKDVKKRQQTAQKRLAKKKRDAKRRKEAARKKKLAKAKAKKDKAARDKAAKSKLAKEKLAKDKAAKSKAAKDKARKDKLALEKAQDEKDQQAFDEQQEQELLEALALEEQQRSMEKALAEEQQVQKNAAITDDIASQIRAKISQTWRYPPSARPDMRVEVRIQLVPTGEVINVSLVTSSGNEALDRSVLAAVKRADPLPVPKDSRLFEQQFRNFSMGFSPKDAVW